MNSLRHTRRLSRSLPPAVAMWLYASSARASEGALELVPQLPLLTALLLLFLLMVAPVNALLFRPLLRMLDERADRIAGTRSRAERLDEQSVVLRGRYESALREARDGAERSRQERVEAARSEQKERTGEARAAAEQRIDSARSELAANLEDARGQLAEQARELAREAAARVLGRSL